MLRHARARQVGRGLLLALLAGAAAGCPYVPPETDYPHIGLTDPVTDTSYWLYKPSYYDQLDDCPLVVTLHGTNPWDGRTRQVLEWRDTAEQFGLIVVAPQLQSTQGYMPVIPSIWYADDRKLAHDERAILGVVDHVRRTHRVAKRMVQRPSPDGKGPPEVVERDLILLTGFSSGGFPLYYTGLRNPDSFDMVIARDCNSSLDLFQKIEITDATRQLPVTIFWGKDDATIRDQSWDAFRFLREHRCFKVERKTIPGGHLRRPDVAIRLWSERLPKKYLR